MLVRPVYPDRAERSTGISHLHSSSSLPSPSQIADPPRHSRFIHSMSAKEERQDHLPTFAATTESLSSTSILTWIYRLDTPPSSSSTLPPTPTLPEETPTRIHQRNRSRPSTPSEFLGDGPAFRKKRKLLPELDVGIITSPINLSTPTSEGSSLSRTRTPSRSITSTAMSGGPNPHTPIPSKKVKYTETPSRLNLRMSLRGLMLNDEAFEEASEFKNMVMGIVGAERGSAMKTSSVKRFRASVEQYEWSNEATFLHHIIPILHGFGYHVKVDSEQDKCVEKGKLEWRDFLVDEGVVYQLDKDFARTLLPGKFDEDSSLTNELTRHLAKETGMINPRPDMVYGLKSEKHSIAVGTEVPPHILELLEIVPDVRHAFLIIEGKSHAGSSAIAENQARRGGATLVKAARKLRAILQEGSTSTSNDETPDLEEFEAPGSLGSPGRSVAQLKQKRAVEPDLNSFVFSVTISPLHFTVWVHWYDEGNQLYHMNLVDSFAVKGARGPNPIRWAMHNIVQWGAGDRADQNSQLIRDIEAYSKAYSQQRAAEEQAAKDQVKGAAKSRRSAEQSKSSSSPLKRASEEEH